MNYEEDNTNHIPFLIKAVVLVVVAVFLVIGVIGIILPIIPGILFLILAAFLMSRISNRFAYFLDNNPAWIKIKDYWRSINFLSLGQRLKLALLVFAKAFVDACDAAVSAFKNNKDND